MRLVLLLVTALAAPALAQSTTDSSAADDRSTWRPTAQGVRLLGGSAGASRDRSETSRSVYVGLAPQIGRFVRDGFALTLQVGASGNRSSGTGFYSADDQWIEEDVRAGTLRLTLGPAVTQYFGAPGARVHPFLSAAAYGAWEQNSIARDDGLVDRSAFGSLYGELRVGVMVPIARNVGIEAQINAPAVDVLDGTFERYVSVSAGIATFLY